MPTAAERKALIFLAAIAVVGGGVRMVEGRRFDREVRRAVGEAARTDSGSADDVALSAQMAAVDSARASGGARGRRRSSRGRRPKINADGEVGTASATPSRSSSNAQSYSSPRSSSNASSNSSSDARSRSKPRTGKLSPTQDAPLNVNDATATELERLPKVGPVLAQRIVAWREAHGPFDSINALRHVPGIGAATASLVAPLVTFSNGYRPSSK